MSNKYKEIEFKFRTKMTPDEVQELMDALDLPEPVLYVGTDYFYSRGPRKFVRHRKNNLGNELTIKEKLHDGNVLRTEIDIGLDHEVSSSDIQKFLSTLFGSKTTPDFKIKKRCYVWTHTRFVLSLSIVNGKESFLEIETHKHSIMSVKQNIRFLEHLERTLRDYATVCGYELGTQVSQSLYELYKPKKKRG